MFLGARQFKKSFGKKKQRTVEQTVGLPVPITSQDRISERVDEQTDRLTQRPRLGKQLSRWRDRSHRNECTNWTVEQMWSWRNLLLR